MSSLARAVKRPTRIGHVHVVKTAGTAVNHAIFRALETSEFHVLKYGTAAEVAESNLPRERCIVRETLAESLARSALFLPGHIGLLEMRALNRDFVFTVLRSPVARLISGYRYQQSRAIEATRAGLEHTLGPGEVAALTSGLADYLHDGHGNNDLVRGVMADTDELSEAIGATDNFRVQRRGAMREAIDSILNQFDAVYDSADAAELGRALTADLQIGTIKIEHENVTPLAVPYPDVASSDIKLRIRRSTWADTLLYNAAWERFPSTAPKCRKRRPTSQL